MDPANATVKGFVAWLRKQTRLPTGDSIFTFSVANRPNAETDRHYVAQVCVNGIPKYRSADADLATALNGLALKALAGQEDQ